MTEQLLNPKPGDVVIARSFISPEKARYWRYAARSASIGGGMMEGTRLKVVSVTGAPSIYTLEIPGRSPPGYLILSGDEVSGNFRRVAAAPARAPLPPPNLAQTFQRLSQKQMAVSGGVAALREAKQALKRDMASAQFWGNSAILANAALLPLNITLNAFDVKPAMSVYKAVVSELYAKFGRSGTRIESGTLKTGLATIKKAAIDALRSQGLSKHIPGVSIIVGLAEDSVALFESMSMVTEGSNEMRALLRQLEQKIIDAEQTFQRIGIEMDRLLTELQRRARMA